MKPTHKRSEKPAHERDRQHPRMRDDESPGMRDRESAQGGEVSVRGWESKRERNSWGRGGRQVYSKTETRIAREKHEQRCKNPV